MEMAHGTDTNFTAFIGICLTDDEQAATHYATDRAGWDEDAAVIHWIDIDLSGLTVIEVEGYDPTNNVAPGDDDEHYGVDVIVFTDETIRGRRHSTWRIVSDRGVATIEYLCTEEPA